MSIVNHEIENVGSVAIHAIETKKYKTNTIAIMFKRKIEPSNITKRALLPHVLKSGTESFPSSLAIHERLEDLYGATIAADVVKKGEYQILSFRLDIANEKFLSDQTPLLQKGLNFLAEVILNPVLEDGGFKQDILEKEQRVLKQKITSIYDDKMRYANMRLVEEMYEDELYSHHAYGSVNEVEEIDSKSLFQYYQSVLSDDQVDIYIAGDIDQTKAFEMVKSSCSELFNINKHSGTNGPSDHRTQKTISNVKEVFEEQDVKQGKLHIGYRTNIKYGDSDYFALQVFNGIFGAFSHSKLFINVREKASLAYYAVSRYESHIGGLFVMSGIESGNYEKTVDIINAQLNSMRNGEFSDQEIEQTKAMLKNQILETIDHPNGLLEMLYHNSIANVNIPITDWLDRIGESTKEDIISVANKVTLDTIYFLKGVENS